MQKSHFPTIWAHLWPWKWGQGHQNLISSFSCHNNIVVLLQVWSKSIHSFMRLDADKSFFNNLSLCVTLKMWSRSPKFNQFFSMSQQHRYTSLVKINQFILETGCRQAIFQQSEPPPPPPSPHLPKGQGQQNLISSCSSLNNVNKFGQNPLINSGDRVQNNYFPAIWVLLWPWKWGQGHQNLISSFLCCNNIVVRVLSKSIHSFMR